MFVVFFAHVPWRGYCRVARFEIPKDAQDSEPTRSCGKVTLDGLAGTRLLLPLRGGSEEETICLCFPWLPW